MVKDTHDSLNAAPDSESDVAASTSQGSNASVASDDSSYNLEHLLQTLSTEGGEDTSFDMISTTSDSLSTGLSWTGSFTKHSARKVQFKLLEQENQQRKEKEEESKDGAPKAGNRFLNLETATNNELLDRIEVLQKHLVQNQIELANEKATRKRKQKSLVKLAKELGKRASEFKMMKQQVLQLSGMLTETKARLMESNAARDSLQKLLNMASESKTRDDDSVQNKSTSDNALADDNPNWAIYAATPPRRNHKVFEYDKETKAEKTTSTPQTLEKAANALLQMTKDKTTMVAPPKLPPLPPMDDEKKEMTPQEEQEEMAVAAAMVKTQQQSDDQEPQQTNKEIGTEASTKNSSEVETKNDSETTQKVSGTETQIGKAPLDQKQTEETSEAASTIDLPRKRTWIWKAAADRKNSRKANKKGSSKSTKTKDNTVGTGVEEDDDAMSFHSAISRNPTPRKKAKPQPKLLGDENSNGLLADDQDDNHSISSLRSEGYHNKHVANASQEMLSLPSMSRVGIDSKDMNAISLDVLGRPASSPRGFMVLDPKDKIRKGKYLMKKNKSSLPFFETPLGMGCILLGSALLLALMVLDLTHPELLSVDGWCSPILPGITMTWDDENADQYYEAPWWMAQGYKETAFGIVCGSQRSRVILHRNDHGRVFLSPAPDSHEKEDHHTVFTARHHRFHYQNNKHKDLFRSQAQQISMVAVSEENVLMYGKAPTVKSKGNREAGIDDDGEVKLLEEVRAPWALQESSWFSFDESD